MAKKSGGELRLCMDYRVLNQNTLGDKHPIPAIKNLIEQIGGSRIFSKLDMSSAYNHIKIAPEDRHKTAFVTQDGHYQLKVMSFGFKNAPPFFQRVMTRILRGIPQAKVVKRPKVSGKLHAISTG